MDFTQIRLMLIGMLHAQYSMNQNDMIDSIMSVIKLLVEDEIKRKQPNIRKFRNLPDAPIVLDTDFWEILARGNRVEIAKHLRTTNKTKEGHNLDLHECMVILEALDPTV